MKIDLILTVQGAVPQVPNPINLVNGDEGFDPLIDLEDGGVALNAVDEKVFKRIGSEIVTFKHSSKVLSSLSLTPDQVKKLYESNPNTNAFTDSEKSKLVMDKGFFVNELAINTAYPEGQGGWYCRNGETDTIWLWDVEGSAWVDSGSNDYLHPETHPLSMITETEDLKVMTADERLNLANVVSMLGGLEDLLETI